MRATSAAYRLYFVTCRHSAGGHLVGMLLAIYLVLRRAADVVKVLRHEPACTLISSRSGR